MSLKIENGYLVGDDPNGTFYVISTHWNLKAYIIAGVLSKVIKHDILAPTGEWREPTAQEKDQWAGRLKMDYGAILNEPGWKPIGG